MISCAQAIENATGKVYEQNEIDEFIKQAQKIRDRINLDDSIADKDAAIRQALDDAKADIVEPKLIEKRNRLINEKRRLELIDFVENAFPEDIGRGIQAAIAGDTQVVAGGRMSVDAEQKSLMGEYFGGMLADLDAEGLLKIAGKGTHDQDIARYMWGEKVDNPEAVKIGDIYNKYQEKARRDQNAAGAYIKKNENYVTRQSHDIDKINKASKDEWIDFILPRLDKRTFDDVDSPRKYLESVYDALSSGVHLSSTKKTSDEIIKQFKGSSNVAKKISQGRSLHFKSADDWMQYNDMFGTGSLNESVSSSIQKAAETTGLMRKFGTNPENMVDALYDHFMSTADDRKELADSRGYTDNLMKVVNGETRMAGSQMGAARMSAIRNVISMSKLGGALLSSIGADNVAYAMEARYQGKNFFSGLGESVVGVTKGRRNSETRQIAANLGVTMDSFVGTMASRFNIQDGHSGVTQKMMNQFFRWNGLSWWTDSLKISAAIGTSNRLYQMKDNSYDDVVPHLKRAMKMYGIESAEWEVIRKGSQVQDDTGLLTPEAQKSIDDSEFAKLIESRGLKASKAAIADARLELERKLRNFVSDRQGFAVLEGDTKSTATWTRGTKRGTVGGELLRSIAQFKQFPTVFAQRVVGREWKGRKSNRDFSGLEKWSESPVYGVASLFTALAIAGYVSMSAKDIAKGRTPRQFNDDPAHNWKIASAALIQGGGLGIYGDFLFGDMTRFGGGPVEAAMGPAISTAGDFIKLWQKVKNGDDPSANAFSLALNNTPFMNLFYVRAPLDYMILYDIREHMNPGYLKRMEKRIKKENEQEFLFPPSTHTARLVK